MGFELRDDLKQRDVEAFESELDRLNPNGTGNYGLKVMGDLVRAAIVAKWIKSPATDFAGDIHLYDGTDVGSIDPLSGVVQEIGGLIQVRWLKYLSPPKN